MDKLTLRVDSVLDRVRLVHSRSVPDLSGEAQYVVATVLDQLIASAVVEPSITMSRPRQCHHCHRLLSNPEHNGIGGGINLCTLEHYELCPGGRRTEKGWTGCPTTDEDTDVDDSQENALDSPSSDTDLHHNSQNTFSIEDKPERETPSDTSRGTKLDPSVLEDALKFAASKANQVILDESVEEFEDTDDEEERLLLEEVANLQLRVEQEKLKANEQVEKKRIKKERLKQLEKQKAELLCQSKSYQVKIKASSPATIRPSIQPVQPSEVAGHVQNRTLHMKASNLATKQQQKSVGNLQKSIDGLTIAGIRALPGMTPAVEQFLTGLQSTAPSLSRTPNATSSTSVSFQPPGVFTALPSPTVETI